MFDNGLTQSLKRELNRLDYYSFMNKKLPNKNDLKKIEEDLFLDLKNKNEVNKKIELISKKNNIFLFKRENISCNFNSRICSSMTKGGYKIYYDAHHITDKGAEFFARIIEKNKLFLKYLNSALHISSN